MSDQSARIAAERAEVCLSVLREYLAEEEELALSLLRAADTPEAAWALCRDLKARSDFVRKMEGRVAAGQFPRLKGAEGDR